ncbi:MAG: aspartate/glutamate racemase family protein [Bacteroidota bacterium]
MKTIGLIGGMSWQSSMLYYKTLNKSIEQQFGGFASCKCLLYSVNFEEIAALQKANDWTALNQLMKQAAIHLYEGGADVIILCANTMHLCSEAIVKAVPIPFLHIAVATGEAIQAKGLKKVGLLGTKFTMEKDFYTRVLADNFQIETLVPNANEREEMHRIIYEELVFGELKASSRKSCQNIITQLEAEGAEGVILGCTEIPLLITPSDSTIPVFDTTAIHAKKAVQWATQDENL